MADAIATVLDEIERARVDLTSAHAAAADGDPAALDALPGIAERLLTIARHGRGLPAGLHLGGGLAFWHGRQVHLTAMSLRIVRHLAVRHGAGCAWRELQEAAHGRPFASGRGDDGFKVNLRAAIIRLRRRFLEVDAGFDRIETLMGYGYRWKSE